MSIVISLYIDLLYWTDLESNRRTGKESIAKYKMYLILIFQYIELPHHFLIRIDKLIFRLFDYLMYLVLVYFMFFT